MHRRSLIGALWDTIVVRMVDKEDILRQTVDLTECKSGPQNFVRINLGENHIHLSDVSRQQAHPQVGVCPSW